MDLKAAGQLVLSGDLTLKELTTAEGSKIDIASGKVLTVKPAVGVGFVLDAEIDKGNPLDNVFNPRLPVPENRSQHMLPSK